MVEVCCMTARASPTSDLSSARAERRPDEGEFPTGFEKALKAKEKELAEAEAARTAAAGQGAQSAQPQPPPPPEQEPAHKGETLPAETGVAVSQTVAFPAAQPQPAVQAGTVQVEGASAGEAATNVYAAQATLATELQAAEGVEPEPAAPPQPAEVPIAEVVGPTGKELPKPEPAVQFTQALEALESEAEAAPAQVSAETTPAAQAKPEAVQAAVVENSGEKVEVKTAAQAGAQLESQPTQAADTNLAAQASGNATGEARPAAMENTVRVEAQVTVQAAETAQQVARSIEASIQSGRNTLRMQLHPHELGSIDVRLVSTGHGVGVTVFADQASTGRLLEMQIDQLRQTLQNAGVQIAHLNINPQGQPAQQQHSAFAQHSRRSFRYSGAHASQASETEALPLGRIGGLGASVDYQV